MCGSLNLSRAGRLSIVVTGTADPLSTVFIRLVELVVNIFTIITVSTPQSTHSCRTHIKFSSCSISGFVDTGMKTNQKNILVFIRQVYHVDRRHTYKSMPNNVTIPITEPHRRS